MSGLESPTLTSPASGPVQFLEQYRIIVCTTCCCAVWPQELQAHFSGKRHKFTKQAVSQLINQVAQWDCIRTPADLAVPGTLANHIPDLRLYNDGLRCRRCPAPTQYICRSLESIRRHCREQHGWSKHGSRGHPRRDVTQLASKGEIEQAWETIQCQRFFRSRQGSQFFAVEPLTAPDDEGLTKMSTIGSDEGRAWEQLFLEAQETEAKIMGGEDQVARIERGQPGQVDQWLERTQWLQHLEGLDPTELLHVIRKPEMSVEPEAYSIWTAIGLLMNTCQTTVSNAPFFVRIKANRASEAAVRRWPLQPYQTKKDLPRHIEPWQQMLMFFIRTRGLIEEERKKYPRYRLNRPQKYWRRRVWMIAERLHGRGDTASGPDVHSSACTECRGDFEHGADINHLQRACMRFCLALLDCTVRNRETECGLIYGLALLGLKPASEEKGATRFGGFRTSREYTSILSSIIKTSRFMVIQDAVDQAGIIEKSGSSSGSDLSRPNSRSGNAKPDDMKERRAGCVERVDFAMNQYMYHDTRGPMDWMLSLRNIGMGMNKHLTQYGDVMWDQDKLHYRDLQFDMDELRGCVHGLVAAARKQLFEELLFDPDNMMTPNIPWEALQDDHSNVAPGWNYLQHPHNQNVMVDRSTGKPVEGRSWLFNHISLDSKLRRRFISKDAAGKPNHTTFRQYMDQVLVFRTQLLLLLHITGGRPARGFEILTLRHSNTAAGGQRNLFVQGGHVVYVTSYHKMFAATQKIWIVHRYLPRSVGELLVLYQWLVLPFQNIFEVYLWTKKQHSDFLWPSDPNGTKWTSQRMRRALTRETKARMGIEINIMNYRHIAIAISRRFMPPTLQFDGDADDEHESADGGWDEGAPGTGQDMTHLQSAHSQRTEDANYARGIEEMPGSMRTMTEMYRMSSICWHRILGFDARSGSQGPGATMAGVKRSASEEADQKEDDLIRRRKRQKDADLTARLRALYGSDASFRGSQEEVLHLIHSGASPIVAVMPTGSGKSLLFMIPALHEPSSTPVSGGVTIVVTPLKSLEVSLRERCRKLGIGCAVWSVGQSPGFVPIVFVTPEAAKQTSFAGYLNMLGAARRLDRIVIDECHVIVDPDLRYRPALGDVGRLTRTQVQFVLLTATLPPSKEEELYYSMLWKPRDVIVIREPTTRKNMSYRVVYARSDKAADIDDCTVRCVQQLLGHTHRAKVIIYCNDVKKVEELAGMLGGEAYHRHATNKAEVLSRFDAGHTRVITATSALSMGINLNGVTGVVHYRHPTSLISFVQESGRGGREVESECISVVVHGGRFHHRPEVEDEQRALVEEYVQLGERPNHCRRVVLDCHMDGRMDRRVCADDEAQCDWCSAGQSNTQSSEQDVPSNRGFPASATSSTLPVSSADTITLADRLDFDESQQRLAESQQRRLVGSRRLARRLELLERYLSRWRQLCGSCLSTRQSDPLHHLFHCPDPASRLAKEWSMQLRCNIRFEKYSACYFCAVPQKVCNRWEEIGPGRFEEAPDGQCQYPDVIIPALAGAICGSDSSTQIRLAWASRLLRSEVEVGLGALDVTPSSPLVSYLARKVHSHGDDISGIAEEFHWVAQWFTSEARKHMTY